MKRQFFDLFLISFYKKCVIYHCVLKLLFYCIFVYAYSCLFGGYVSICSWRSKAQARVVFLRYCLSSLGLEGKTMVADHQPPRPTCHHFNMRTGTTGAQNCSSKFYVCPEDITEFLMSARQTLYRPRCLWEIIFQYHDNIIKCGGIVYFCHYFTSLFDFAYFWSWSSMFYIVKDVLNLWILLLPPLEYEGNGHELPCQALCRFIHLCR